jgi:hypothetical protein
MSARSLLSAFAFVCAALPARAYVSAEHKALGDGGMTLALQRYTAAHHASPFANAPKLKTDGPQIWTGGGAVEIGWFTFGDLVAAYGDMCASYEEMTSPYGKANGAAFADIAAHGDYDSHPPVKKHMLQLATLNETHFSAKAVEAYVKWHGQALQTARGGKAKLWLALQYEALANHSLTDLFAVGHMMADRDATMKLEAAAKKESSLAHAEIQKGIAYALKAEIDFLHGESDDVIARYVLGFRVNFIHNGFNHWGARVSNLAGQEFQLYGDHRLADSPDGRRAIEEAVASSVLQVLETANGNQPKAAMANAALRFLPVRFKNAARSVAMEKEKVKVLEALAKQRQKVISQGGLDASLLAKETVPDGSVAYLPELQKLCGAGCK